MRVVALCSPPLSTGFRLAGVDVVEATDAVMAEQKLSALNQQRDIGIVLVDQELSARFAPAAQRALTRAALPIVVPFPSRLWAHEPSSAEAYIAEILRHAIGYRVRLQ